ncbi:MAG: class I SAM-dependent RNA methyltransferase [Myxococcales bacterium]|nr:class I SAM-dependent RNA methyltransferase [Myxococcales bacterium]
MTQWKVDKLVPGGHGMCRLDGGGVGFVRGAAPGDLVHVKQIKRRSGYQRAESWALVEAGPGRVEPGCALHGRCGGCDWMHLELSMQREAKVKLLTEALVRTGGFDAERLPRIELVSAGPAEGYRCRAQLQVDAKGRLGFFSAGTHDLVEVDGCLVCDPRLSQMISELQALAKQGLFRGFSRLELRVADRDPERLLRASVRERGRDRRRKHREVRSDQLEASLKQLGIAWVLEGSVADAELCQGWRIADELYLSVPPAAFAQVNPEVNRSLIGAVVEGARRRAAARFLDLYCGAGNFSFPLAAAGLSGVGIEISDAAITAAKSHRPRVEALLGRELDLEFHAGDVEPALSQLPRRDFDLILLDPPRAGAKASLSFVVQSEAHWLCMCSCDPVTLARDLRELVHSGFELEQLTAYDMFPHTHHVAALAWLRRVAR